MLFSKKKKIAIFDQNLGSVPLKNQHYFINIASNDLGRKNKSNAKIIVSIVSNDFYHKLN